MPRLHQDSHIFTHETMTSKAGGAISSIKPLKKKPEEILGELIKEVKLIAERNLTSFI